MPYATAALVAALCLGATQAALARIGNPECPTHDLEMVWSGRQQFEKGATYKLYRCTYGDTWWFPDGESTGNWGMDQVQTIQRQSQPRGLAPTINLGGTHPCPACGKMTIYKGMVFVDMQYKTSRACLDGHESVWGR